MKAKPSGLSAAVIGIAMIVTVLLVIASASSPTAGVAMMFGGQGGGRPTPKPRRTPAKHTKPSTPRPRPKALGSKANNGNKAAPDRNAGANSNTPSTSNTADKANIVPAPLNTSSPRSATAKPKPDADILLPENFLESESLQVKLETDKPIYTTGMLSEISDKRKVFVNLIDNVAGDVVTGRLKAYGKLEIVKTAGEAEFAVHYYYNHKGVGETGLSIVRGGVMIITIRDASKGVPRIIWLKIDNGESDNNLGFLNNADDINQSFIRLINPPGRLADHFISELKKLRREDADILLPPDFNYFQPSNPEKPRNTEGKFSEISNKRKVFVNVEGEAGEKITARLREYGRLEIVKTAGEAEIAVNYFSVSRVEAIARVVTGGTIIITIRDPLQHVPRIIWQKDDTDGGWLKRGDAFDKLIKRFISELKKLRGEK